MPTRASATGRRHRKDRTPGRAPGLLERKRDLVRETIAHAAWDLFAAEGYEPTTVAEIARAAGVSRRTFFRYFSSKEDVVMGTTDALAEDLLASFARRPPDEPPLAAIHGALRPVLESRLADASEARAIVRLLRESRTLRRAMLERHARMEERLAALLAERMGTSAREDPTPALLAFVTRALVDTAFNVWYDQRPRDVGAMIDGLFRRLRTVVSTGGPAPRARGGRAPARSRR